MSFVRRLSLMATAGLLGIAVMLGLVSARPSINATSISELASSVAYFDSTIVLARNARPTGERGDGLAISLGYLERERVGVADPFRLADEALADPRLDSVVARRVSWALLGRLLRGDAYVVDPAVLEGNGPWSKDGHGASGAAHLALIERAVATASDPRAGELAVRLAYTIEAGKGVLSSGAPGIATQVAALVRDRRSAEHDLRDLLDGAAQRHDDALRTLVARRDNRELRVEQPALAPLSAELRTEAMNAVPALIGQLDTLDRVTATPVSASTEPVIAGAFAARLGALGARQPMIAQVAVTLRGFATSGPGAGNDEIVIANYSLLGRQPDSLRRQAALALLATAVASRSRAQAQPWFVGDGGPDASDVAAEFGLNRVQFARTVPAAWRPFYLREVRDALRDMQRVYPALSLEGLNISLGTAELPDSALAMHDPRTRTLKLTIGTSGGTLAHELAHDLDWQTAHRMFTVAGGYSTDRAIRERHGALASSVRGLAEARLLRPISTAGGTGAAPAISALPDRPAELFARSADWFAATTLALMGRTNGFLTAVQDAALPGYAAGAPAAVGNAGTAALLTALDQMTFVPDSTLAAFESTWARASTIDPLLLVRRVFATPIGRITLSTQAGLVTLPPARPAICTVERSDEDRARARLLALALEARAKGLAMRRARYRFANARTDWTNGMLGIPPWSAAAADQVVTTIAAAIANELRAAPADQGVVPAIPASFRSSDANCSAILR